jgi:hypothetical protein
MIDLNATPEAVLTLGQGDECMLDGRVFVCDALDDAGRIYLTTKDSRNHDYNVARQGYESDRGYLPRKAPPNYHAYITHVRVGSAAVVAREKLLHALTAHTYTIG